MQDMILIVEPLIPGLRRYARALLRDATAADDLVQDCLERAIGRWHQRHGDGDARSWLYAILHNLAVSEMRRAARRGPHVALGEEGAIDPGAPPTQEDGLHHRALLDALATLPEDQRAALLLVSVEDMSYADTARVLGVPIGTVMSRIARAREKLRRAIEAGSVVPEARQPLRRVK
jgi:RNA polymerase sigma factor (sigma-70 family)